MGVAGIISSPSLAGPSHLRGAAEGERPPGRAGFCYVCSRAKRQNNGHILEIQPISQKNQRQHYSVPFLVKLCSHLARFKLFFLNIL